MDYDYCLCVSLNIRRVGLNRPPMSVSKALFIPNMVQVRSARPSFRYARPGRFGFVRLISNCCQCWTLRGTWDHILFTEATKVLYDSTVMYTFLNDVEASAAAGSPHVIVAAVVIVWMTTVAILRAQRASYMLESCNAALAARQIKESRHANKKKKKTKPKSGNDTGTSTDTGSGTGTGTDTDTISDAEYGSAWRVHNFLTACELKWEAWLAMSARGLFLTYGIPSIARCDLPVYHPSPGAPLLPSNTPADPPSTPAPRPSSVLHKTGGFDTDTDRRYADMELLIREFNENDPNPDGCAHFDGQPERARTALLRLNAIHDAYGSVILYRDMMYVLAVFMTTPFLLMESRWSWRRCTVPEKECIFLHWVDIGTLMGLRVQENFACLDDVVAYKYAYEEKHMRHCKSNSVVGDATIEFFITGVVWTPMQAAARPLVHMLMSVLQERPQHAAALGLPLVQSAPLLFATLAAAVDVTLTFKALFTKYLLPPLPLGWKDRLTGDRPQGSSGSSSSSSSSGGGGGKCPFSFRPMRALDFNNATYTPTGALDTGAYVIENMGPRHIPAGAFTGTPRYVGLKEGKII